jgi:hypothetical protein
MSIRYVGQGAEERLLHHRIGEIVVKIGRTTGVKVASKTTIDPKTGKRVEVVKYASSHDLRWSFGEPSSANETSLAVTDCHGEACGVAAVGVEPTTRGL